MSEADDQLREIAVSASIWTWHMALSEAELLIAAAQRTLDREAWGDDDMRLRLQNVIDRNGTMLHRLKELRRREVRERRTG